MFKKLFLFLALSAFIVSCTTEDNETIVFDNSKLIVGTWQCRNTFQYRFYKDGTFIYGKHEIKPNKYDSNYSTWVLYADEWKRYYVENDVLHIYGEYSDSIFYILALTETDLILKDYNGNKFGLKRVE